MPLAAPVTTATRPSCDFHNSSSKIYHFRKSDTSMLKRSACSIRRPVTTLPKHVELDILDIIENLEKRGLASDGATLVVAVMHDKRRV